MSLSLDVFALHKALNVEAREPVRLPDISLTSKAVGLGLRTRIQENSCSTSSLPERRYSRIRDLSFLKI